MARGENPGGVLPVETNLTYDQTKPYGHDNAGKDLVLSLITSGGNAGKAQLGVNGARIHCKFLDLDKNKEASGLMAGHPILLRKTAATITVGDSLVCGGDGKVKNPTSVAEHDNARGFVIEVLETADNGRILAWMP